MQRSYTLPRHLYFNPMTHVVVAVVAVVAIVISYFSVITMDGLTNKNSQSITSRRNIVSSLSRSARILKRIRTLPCQKCHICQQAPWRHTPRCHTMENLVDRFVHQPHMPNLVELLGLELWSEGMTHMMSQRDCQKHPKGALVLTKDWPMKECIESFVTSHVTRKAITSTPTSRRMRRCNLHCFLLS